MAFLTAGAASAQNATAPAPNAATPARNATAPASNAATPAPGTGGSNGAVNGSGNAPSNVNASGTIRTVPMTALATGANSFTEGQARSRIESAGFTGVTGLKQDGGGIWRGQATHDGRPVQVGFDYKGQLAFQ